MSFLLDFDPHLQFFRTYGPESPIATIAIMETLSGMYNAPVCAIAAHPTAISDRKRFSFAADIGRIPSVEFERRNIHGKLAFAQKRQFHSDARKTTFPIQIANLPLRVCVCFRPCFMLDRPSCFLQRYGTNRKRPLVRTRYRVSRFFCARSGKADFRRCAATMDAPQPVAVVMSVGGGFFSAYLPYKSYFKNRYSLENGGGGKDDE